MSQPAFSLPFEIAELMTETFVTWKQSLVTDINGQWTYAAPVEIPCWVEGEGYGSSAGLTNSRATFNQNILQQTRRPEVDLYFSGDNTDARSFTMNDRFTLTGMPAASLVELNPTSIETMFSPPFDNVNPNLVVVGF